MDDDASTIEPFCVGLSSSSGSNGGDVDVDQGKSCSSDLVDEFEEEPMRKKAKVQEGLGFGAPPPLFFNSPPLAVMPLSVVMPDHYPNPDPEPEQEDMEVHGADVDTSRVYRQFWKAGDYCDHEANKKDSSSCYGGGLDRLRVHPRFLHSNATSHKWALGAFAELLDNALDEVCNGATYVHVDMLKNKKDGSNMLLVQDNGGGMTPDKMRQCMSLGYSSKSKMANVIGLYGNGFKTSTMRLGADVVVFSSCKGGDGRVTRSVGILSYTFLLSTKQEDIIVPMVDYVKRGEAWEKIVKSSAADWTRNLRTIVQWSPYSCEQDLLEQFNLLEGEGTRIIVYNLWEDDEGNPELDFDTDPHDILLRGVNGEDNKTQMAKQYPSSSHFLTYRHSLRSYSAILYLKLPTDFKIILRGKDVKHHCIEDDIMICQETTYKPKDLHFSENGVLQKVVASVTLGFVKDARHHIDIQGFNIYHKNRLIKPYCRVWNAAGSGGRGVIGVVEANFVKPTHDKQGFEHSVAHTRLLERLCMIQKTYWHAHSHEIGYARKPAPVSEQRSIPKENSSLHEGSIMNPSKISNNKSHHRDALSHEIGYVRNPTPVSEQSSIPKENSSLHESSRMNPSKISNDKSHHRDIINEDKSARKAECNQQRREHQDHIAEPSQSKAAPNNGHGCTAPIGGEDGRSKLLEENRLLRKRLMERGGSVAITLFNELCSARNNRKSLENKLEEAQESIKKLNDEQEVVISMISQERVERDESVGALRNKIRDASMTINRLMERTNQTSTVCKMEKN